tara:strand:+ start:724 stop:981 length:258 start_codon:yes stop_codon:yes gene_type:complete
MEKQELIDLISEVMYFREPELCPPDALKLVNKFLVKHPKYLAEKVEKCSVLDDVNKRPKPTEKQCYKSCTGLGVECKEHCGSNVC